MSWAVVQELPKGMVDPGDLQQWAFTCSTPHLGVKGMHSRSSSGFECKQDGKAAQQLSAEETCSSSNTHCTLYSHTYMLFAGSKSTYWVQLEKGVHIVVQTVA